jgi:hypothetical protein
MKVADKRHVTRSPESKNEVGRAILIQESRQQSIAKYSKLKMGISLRAQRHESAKISMMMQHVAVIFAR